MNITNRCMLLTAQAEYGVSEIEGPGDNPRIIQYYEDTGLDYVFGDEDAWCSVFWYWVAMRCGCERPAKDAKLARSWLKVGEPINEPGTGDTVVYWRKSKDSIYGHVGGVVSVVGDYIYTIGGNQNNMVCIEPYHRSRMLGFRRLLKPGYTVDELYVRD